MVDIAKDGWTAIVNGNAVCRGADWTRLEASVSQTMMAQLRKRRNQVAAFTVKIEPTRIHRPGPSATPPRSARDNRKAAVDG